MYIDADSECVPGPLEPVNENRRTTAVNKTQSQCPETRAESTIGGGSDFVYTEGVAGSKPAPPTT